MKSLLVLFFLVLVNFSFGKEQVIYRADGGGLFDLIRGIPPKDGSLQFKKVNQADTASLPDGIYFVPDGPIEDEAVKLDVSVSRPFENISRLYCENISNSVIYGSIGTAVK